MTKYLPSLLALLTALSALQCRRTESSGDAAPYFSVTFSGDSAMDGRLLLLISTDDSAEPRFQISDGPGTQQVFGLDVNDWQPGSEAVFTKEDFGYPVQSLSELPAGEYFVQVLLQKYETFRRADGHVVQLPMDQGEGRQWNRAPGNPYSKPRKVHFDPAKAGNISIELDQIIPPIEPPKDTEYVKHIRIRSKMLSEFWGRDMYLGAHVLLPQGWAEHPDVKYPLAIFHGHFNYDLGGWRTTPPDTTQPCEYNERFQVDCYNRLVQQEAYDFYKMWTGPNFPRVIVIDIQHANPYYDDSYAVNSANLGPYGDAITYELIPYIEQQFRGIDQGWARFLYGGSTGGWEALAAQVFYPAEYNGCYAACPDPIDFRAYTVVNIYEDENAYYTEGPFRKTLRPGTRNALGHISATLRDANYKELALGTRSRSGDQWDIWEAVYSPTGKDGYPQPIWDKRSGVIDKKVAAHWRENYDLAYILKRDWPKNGVDWRGKIHLYCGDMDNYYLNNAVYLTEEILEKVSNPPYDGEVDYGDRAEHCWNGDHTQPNYISRLRYHRMFIPKWTEEVQKRAPKGADLRGWRY
ncbi:MAG TPA: alpha/beta hydrolase-fold protein [Saprospiraceae bacterium]|nr:alpha/beta hydrolase-fold protein [Saprospiraceae bacterium]